MRQRLRELGFTIGHFPVGQWNAITDVEGVKVGHTTVIIGDGPLEVGKGPVRTGVTAVIPQDNVFDNRVLAGGFVLNGAGEVSGLTQVQEWGLLETPILLTNTMSVGKVSDAAVKWMTRKWPGIGGEDDVVIPLVGECDDSWLNDAVGRHVRSEHVYRAIEQATGGKVAEGSVGAGTGLITCDFKAGIGTSSRRVGIRRATNTPSASWCSRTSASCDRCASTARRWARCWSRCSGRRDARTTPGRSSPSSRPTRRCCRRSSVRLCKRAALGIGRIGSFAAHGSGEIIVGFSTSNVVPRQASKMKAALEVLLDEACDPLYEAVVECTEEAIVNSLCMADEMRGQSGHVAPALPLDRLSAILRHYSQAFATSTGRRGSKAAKTAKVGRDPPRCVSVSSSPTFATSNRRYAGVYLALSAHRRGHDVRFVSVDDLSFLDDNNILATTTRVARRRLRHHDGVRARAGVGGSGRRGGDAGELRRRVPALQPDPRGARTARARRSSTSAGGCGWRARWSSTIRRGCGAPAAACTWAISRADVRTRMLVSRSKTRLKAFLKALDAPAVLKPLAPRGGEHVFYLRRRQVSNLNQIIAAVTKDGYALAQEYLPEAEQGEKRLLLLNAEPIRVGDRVAIYRRRAVSAANGGRQHAVVRARQGDVRPGRGAHLRHPASQAAGGRVDLRRRRHRR